MRSFRTWLVAAAVAVLVGGVPGTASAATPAEPSSTGEFAPLDRVGPALSVKKAALDASLSCNGPLRGLAQDPILLVPGTGLTPQVNFSWNYLRAFDRLGYRWCAVTLPQDATGDIQVAGEYVVSALRTMAKQSGRQVDVLGYSQGGMVPRWALRFWPDTRSLVDDVIGLSPSNHGTVVADAACSARPCTPANHQQASQANFMRALNSGAETFAGIDYTVAYTRSDEIVVPNAGPTPSSAVYGGAGRVTNIALQDVCPTDTADHFAIGSYDAVGFAIVADALVNDGPAVPGRIPLTTCAQLFQPGVDPLTFSRDYPAMVTYAGNSSGNAPSVPAEPPLRPYVLAGR